MKTKYLISEIDGRGYWSQSYRAFKGFLYRTEFDSEEELLQSAQYDNVGVFKIIKYYDTK